MSITIEDMIGYVQEWYAQVYTFESLEKIHYALKSEVDKQFLHMADKIAEEKKGEN